MVDISPGTVTHTVGETDVRNGICGVAITGGDPLRLNSSTTRFEPAQADAASTATVVGLALHAAAIGQPIAYAISGPLTMGSVLTVGTVYVLSAAAAGGIAPWADLASTEIVSVLGVATAATALPLSINNSGAVMP